MKESLPSHLCLALQHLWAPQTVWWVDTGQHGGVMEKHCHTGDVATSCASGEPPEPLRKLFPLVLGRGKDLYMEEH